MQGLTGKVELWTDRTDMCLVCRRTLGPWESKYLGSYRLGNNVPNLSILPVSETSKSQQSKRKHSFNHFPVHKYCRRTCRAHWFIVNVRFQRWTSVAWLPLRAPNRVCLASIFHLTEDITSLANSEGHYGPRCIFISLPDVLRTSLQTLAGATDVHTHHGQGRQLDNDTVAF